VFAIMIANTRSRLHSARRVLATGTPVRCSILSKRGGVASRGRSYYYVTLQRRDRPELPSFERRVGDQAWLDAKEGAETTFFIDPDHPETGVAEIERSFIEDHGLPGQAVFLAAALAWTGGAVWDALRRKKR